jgi:ankyrin repeat protein
MTPLMFAAHYCPLDVMTAIIDAGADINAKDTSGKTALNHALEWGNTENADYLRDKGAVVG